MNLRERTGTPTGQDRFFSYHRSPGPFIVFSDVRTDVTAPATSEVFNELKRMRDTQMTPTELLLSKDPSRDRCPGGSSAGQKRRGPLRNSSLTICR